MNNNKLKLLKHGRYTLNVNNADQNQTPHHVAYFNRSHAKKLRHFI